MSSAVDENTYILVGSELSYFAAKIRAYLKWKRIPFVEALASQHIYKTIIRPLTHTNYIPILLLPRSQCPNGPKAIQDTRTMIRYLEQAHPNLAHPVFPSSPQLAFTAATIELVADQWINIQGRFWMGYSDVLSKQRDFIMAELGDTILGGAKAAMEEKIAADQQAWTDFPNVLPGLGITDATAGAIKEQFSTVLRLLNIHFGKWRFLLGDRISLADFSLYAPFGAHLARNPVPGNVLKTEAPLVWEWVERVAGLARGGSAHGGVVVLADDGRWVDEYPSVEDKELPETLIPLLELWLSDYIPVLAETCAQVERYLEEGKGRKVKGRKGWVELPRAVGWQWFELTSGKEGLVARGRRVVSPHAVWMLSMLVEEVYQGKEKEGDEVMARAVGRVMAENGAWKRCVDWIRRGKWVVERVDNRLIAGPRGEEAKL